MSKRIGESLSAPCFLARESRFCCRRPTAITCEPLEIIFSARARPMPDVAPRTRMVL